MFNPKSNRGYKNLWSYVKRKKCDQVTIPPLDVNSLTISDPLEKANAINTQFLSVHTEEDVSTLPDLGLHHTIDSITVEGVAKLICRATKLRVLLSGRATKLMNPMRFQLIYCI